MVLYNQYIVGVLWIRCTIIEQGMSNDKYQTHKTVTPKVYTVVSITYKKPFPRTLEPFYVGEEHVGFRCMLIVNGLF